MTTVDLNLSPEYVEALEASNEASRIFDVSRKAHLAGEITDAEYFAAKAIFDEASRIFDLAWDAEQAREPEEVPTDEDDQLDLIEHLEGK